MGHPHKVTFASLCQCMTECKSVYFDELSGHMLDIFWNYKQLRCGAAEKIPLNTAHKLPNRA